jgi:hypothetical protein
MEPVIAPPGASDSRPEWQPTGVVIAAPTGVAMDGVAIAAPTGVTTAAPTGVAIVTPTHVGGVVVVVAPTGNPQIQVAQVCFIQKSIVPRIHRQHIVTCIHSHVDA